MRRTAAGQSMPRLLIISLAVLLVACAVGENAQRRVTGKEVAPEPVKALPLPYSQMELRINGGLPGRLMLVQQDGAVQQWLAADGTSLWLEYGLVVATRGLSDDLLRTEALRHGIRSDAVLGQKALAASVIFVETQSEPTGRIFEVAREMTDSKSVTALRGGYAVTLRQVNDVATDPLSGDRWQRRLWLATDGRMMLSLQEVPGTDIELRLERIFPQHEAVPAAPRGAEPPPTPAKAPEAPSTPASPSPPSAPGGAAGP